MWPSSTRTWMWPTDTKKGALWLHAHNKMKSDTSIIFQPEVDFKELIQLQECYNEPRPRVLAA